MRSKISKACCLLIAALGVGWLEGLSASPVLHVVVGSALALVVAIVSAMAGVDGESKPLSDRYRGGTNPVPIAIFAIGLATGATAGLMARTHELFGPDQEGFVRRWHGTGLPDVALKRRLFDQLYPPATSEDPRHASDTGNHREATDRSAPRETALTAALFAASVEDCALLADRRSADLRARLQTVGGDAVGKALAQCAGDDCAEAFKALLCPSARQESTAH